MKLPNQGPTLQHVWHNENPSLLRRRKPFNGKGDVSTKHNTSRIYVPFAV
jgi:hypothetical protein